VRLAGVVGGPARAARSRPSRTASGPLTPAYRARISAAHSAPSSASIRAAQVADTASRREYAEGYLLHLTALEWFGRQYVAGPQDLTEPRLAVDRSPAVGLPPTLIVTDEYDPLRDEAEKYGDRLRDAGVEVTVRRFDGLVHGVYWMSAAVPRSAEQRQTVADFLRNALGRPVTAPARGG
jgi:acetyl esterase